MPIHRPNTSAAVDVDGDDDDFDLADWESSVYF